MELVEHSVPDSRHGQGLSAIDDLDKSGKVRACHQREKLSGDRDCDDVFAGERSIKCPVEFSETPGAQSIGSGVAKTVV
jgi:hypothetical protein